MTKVFALLVLVGSSAMMLMGGTAHATSPVKLCVSDVGTVTVAANDGTCPLLTAISFDVQADAPSTPGSFTYTAVINPDFSIASQDMATNAQGVASPWLQSVSYSNVGFGSPIVFALSPGVISEQANLTCSASNMQNGGQPVLATNVSANASRGYFSFVPAFTNGNSAYAVPDQSYVVTCMGY